jgi:hypothetical protein
MTQNPTMKGEKIYEYEFNLTGVTDYGVSMDAILAGKDTVPLQGARFDLTVEDAARAAFRGGRTASIIFECEPMVASTLTYT